MNRVVLLAGLLSICGAVPVVSSAADDAPSTPPPSSDVYLLPFQSLTPGTNLGWAGKAVQQTMAADLARAGLHAVAADRTAATDVDARAAARAAGAKYVVTGSYQVVAEQVRITGQVADTAGGTTVGALSVTGPGRDLFALEDQVSAQLVRRLRSTPTVAATLPPATTRPIPPDLQSQAIATMTTPAAADLSGASYQGSALQSYVDGNRTPSNDYTQAVIDARTRNTYGSYNSAGFGGYGGFGYGGFGYGGLGLGGFGYGLGGFGAGYGGFGYGGLGYGGFGYGGYGSGGYLLGISYPIGSVGPYGIGYGGYGGGFTGYDYGGRGFGGPGYFAGRGYNANGGFRVTTTSGGGFRGGGGGFRGGRR